jgi:uncharacterized protein YaaN involved in tellurite resistance
MSQPEQPTSQETAPAAATTTQDVATATALEPLTPPQPVAAVTPEQAPQLVQISPEQQHDLTDKAQAFANDLGSLDTHSAAFQAKLKAVYEMGNSDIKSSASVSNRLLDKPTRAMEQGVFDTTSNVSHSLVELRRVVEDLDPSAQGVLGKKRLFGLIPFGDRLRDYFAKYQSSQSHINAIINALLSGQDDLQQDNASIEQEKVNLWQTMDRLRQYVFLAQQLDTALSAKITEIEATDPDKAKVLREDALFYIRQKVQDLLTQLAVDAQGYLALDMIRKNNLELIKGVDRATTTTISALRTAVIVAQALADQKLVLDQITALNTTTSHLIESTSQLLRDQSAKVHEQASSSTIDLDSLKTAFANIYATLDEIDSYKLRALDTMQQTVTALATEVQDAQTHLDRIHEADEKAAQISAPAASSPELTL